MNGATEATLAELLAVAESMNVNISRLVSGLGSGGSGGGLAGAAAAATPVGKAFSLLSGAASLASGALSGLLSVVKNLWGGLIDTGKALYDFSLKAVEGSARLSDFYRALERLPFFIGTIAGLVADFVKYTERLLDTYRDLSRTGASFSGNLFAMALQASKSYLTLSEFAKIVSKNSDIFASMGGNVQAGINQFVNVQNRLMGPNSTYARQLLGLGYTFEEAGELVASYMRGQGNIAKLEKENINSITAGIMKYAIELDTLTKMTGKRREQLEAEVREIEQEQEWQAYLAALPKDAAELAKTALTQAIGVGGKEIGPSVRLAIQTGLVTPLDDNQAMLSIISKGQREVFLNSIYQMTRAGVSIETMGTRIRELGLTVGKSVGEFRTSAGVLPQVTAATGNNILKAGQGFDAFARNVKNVQTAEQKAAAEREKQYQGNAAALARAEQAIRQFGTTLFGTVARYLEKLSPILSNFATGILNFVTGVISTPEFQRGFDQALTWLKDAIIGIGNWIGRTYNQLKKADGFGDAVGILWNSVKDPILSLWDKVWPYLAAGGQIMMEKLYSIMKEVIVGGPASELVKANENIAEFTEKLKDNSLNFLQRKWYEERLKGAKENAEFYGKLVEEQNRRTEKGFQPLLEMYQQQAEKNRQERVGVGGGRGFVVPPLAGARAVGTLGVTGKFWETGPKAVTIGESGPESVINPEIMREVVAASSSLGSKNLVDQLNQLNNTQVRLVTLLSRIEDNTKRSFNAINNLNRDQFSMA